MCIKLKFNKTKGNSIIISKTYSYMTLSSFNSLKLFIEKNKKLYNTVQFKKIPLIHNKLYIKPLDIILEFSEFAHTFSVLKKISSKVSFKIQLINIIYKK